MLATCRLAIAGFLIGMAATGATAQDACGLPASFDDPHPVLNDGSRSLFWVRPLEVNADGARNAYHRDDPQGNKGLAVEYIGNGMTIRRNGKKLEFMPDEQENGEWLEAYHRVVKNGWQPSNGLDVDIYGFARDANGKVCTLPGGRLVAATSLVQDRKARECNPKRYVDALQLPGIVVPSRAPGEKKAGTDPEVAPPFAERGVSRGDLAVVYNPETKIWKGAFLYDTGPRNLLGEGSLRLVLDLWNKHLPPKNALETNSLGLEETYVVLFPGTAKRMGPGRTWTQSKIQTLAAYLLKTWGGGSVDGGLERLFACAGAYKSKFKD